MLQLTPRRALVARLARALRGAAAPRCSAPDRRDAALAAIAVEGDALLRRLTDLDLAALPASRASVAGVQAFVARGEGGFRIFFAQEYGHSVVEAVRDAQEGLA